MRLSPQTPMLLPGSTYPRLEWCCSARGARTGHHSPCGKQLSLRSPRPQAQSCRNALAARSACSAVDCTSLRGKHVPGADGMCPRFAQTVKRYACGFFSFFSCADKKRTRFSFPKENKDVVFSPTRKRRKESLRLPPQTPIHLLGSTYTRLPTDGTAHLRALSVIRRVESVCDWKSAPAGARRAPCERFPVRYSK